MEDNKKKNRTDEEWRTSLTPEEYRVLREKGTELAFTGAYYNTKDKGMYLCAACGKELFSSELKFDSGTGWPSFYAPVSNGTVSLTDDESHGMHRTEALCSRCGSHLGHVFDDGPKTLPDGRRASGKRFCINSISLKLKKDSEADS